MFLFALTDILVILTMDILANKLVLKQLNLETLLIGSVSLNKTALLPMSSLITSPDSV